MSASGYFALGALIVAAPHFSKSFAVWVWTLFSVLTWLFMWVGR